MSNGDDGYTHSTAPARPARRFELREVDDETGAELPGPIYTARWNMAHPPAYIVSGPLPVGDGLVIHVEVRRARTLDHEGR